MKKKLIFAIAGAFLLACLIPMPFHLKDGGTVEYKALLYTVSRAHRLIDLDAERPYQEGTVVKVLGVELYNSVR